MNYDDFDAIMNNPERLLREAARDRAVDELQAYREMAIQALDAEYGPCEYEGGWGCFYWISYDAIDAEFWNAINALP
jgi:hypothetical protein